MGLIELEAVRPVKGFLFLQRLWKRKWIPEKKVQKTKLQVDVQAFPAEGILFAIYDIPANEPI